MSSNLPSHECSNHLDCFFARILDGRDPERSFPNIGLFAYAPFVAVVCIYASFPQALWLSALAGLCSDLFASGPMGINAICTTLTCALIHRYQKSFFKDLSLQLCFYSALISAIMSLLLLALLFLFDRPAPIAGKSFLIDLIAMPLIDAAYAFFWFVGPLILFEWGQKKVKLWKNTERT